MSLALQQQRTQQARTSITKAGQPIGCVHMCQCASNWLKPQADSGCLR